MYPTFLIAGPPRSASTSLYYYLRQHPQIYMSPVKETEFFTRDYHKGGAFYERYFSRAGNAAAIGEATPSYSFLPFAADRIKDAIPDVKLIFCFRNPVERAYSHWLMLYNEGVEKADFKEAIEINREQMAYINFEGEKGAETWNKTAAHCRKEKNWIRPYLYPGMYAASLNMYRKKFSGENIMVIFTNDLKNDFNGTMKSLFAFLEVDDDFIITGREIQNASGSKQTYRMLANMFGFRTAGIISRRVPASLKNIMRKAKVMTPAVSREDAYRLWDIYQTDIKKLSIMTQRNLDSWNCYTKHVINA